MIIFKAPLLNIFHQIEPILRGLFFQIKVINNSRIMLLKMNAYLCVSQSVSPASSEMIWLAVLDLSPKLGLNYIREGHTMFIL